MDLETFSKILGVGWNPQVQGELGGGEGHDEVVIGPLRGPTGLNFKLLSHVWLFFPSVTLLCTSLAASNIYALLT